MAKGRVCSKQNTHEIIQNETLSFKKIIVSGLGGCAKCHLQCTANIRVGGGHWEFARETAAGAVLKAADLISDGMDGRSHFG